MYDKARRSVGATVNREQLVLQKESFVSDEEKRDKNAVVIENCAKSINKDRFSFGQENYRDWMDVLLTLSLPSILPAEESRARITHAHEQLRRIKPGDGLEHMLAVQMVSVHQALLECLRRAARENQTQEGRDYNLKHATKLAGLFARQMETLDKHRGKGQQKVTVEHVHVESGGQALVGTVHTGPNVIEASPQPVVQPTSTTTKRSAEPMQSRRVTPETNRTIDQPALTTTKRPREYMRSRRVPPETR